jgi:hypothetical protein
VRQEVLILVASAAWEASTDGARWHLTCRVAAPVASEPPASRWLRWSLFAIMPPAVDPDIAFADIT